MSSSLIQTRPTNMKVKIFLPFVLACAASLVLPRPELVDYDGYKVYRVKTQQHLQAVQEKLSTLDFEQWNHNILDHIDLSISPEHVSTFESLGLDYYCMHEDLGASIAKESESISIWKRQLDDLSWFDSYHSYDDHHQYFLDLHDAFPDNSEMISSGTSYEGRDLWGIHLWGADGPGTTQLLCFFNSF